jgi:SprT protein
MNWVRFACERNGVPELAQAVVVEWNPRFTRRMGDGMYCPLTYRARIRLSLPLWPRCSEKDRRETVIHEACHVIVKYRFTFSLVKDHGAEGRQAMRNYGVEPLRTHTVDRSGLARRQRRLILLGCPNQGIGQKCRMRVREYNQVQQGAELYCKKCGILVTRDSPMEEDRNDVATVQEL